MKSKLKKQLMAIWGSFLLNNFINTLTLQHFYSFKNL